MLRATWEGKLPNVGDVLRSVHRARAAYLITAIHEYAPGKLKLTVDRIELRDIPAGAGVWPWFWAKRGRSDAGRGEKRAWKFG